MTRRGRVVATFVSGITAGLVAGWAMAGPGPAASRVPSPVRAATIATTASPRSPSPPADHVRASIAAALSDGVRRATALGAEVEAAVAADDWPAAVTAGRARRRIRMWSTSKAVTAVATLQAAGQRPPSAELREAMIRAITRSENCPQRRVVLGLQQLVGGAASAHEAIRAVLRRAGATDSVVARVAVPPDPACVAYLQTSTLADPLAPALTLGTSRWTVVDAARFGLALGTGRYGAPGATVLGLMRRSKHVSDELSSPDEYTADPDWGAGRALRGLVPAYKAGWGGAQQGRFVAEQLAVVRAGHHVVAIAVAVHPALQPPVDDPGRTVAPRAIETVMRAVRIHLGEVA